MPLYLWSTTNSRAIADRFEVKNLQSRYTHAHCFTMSDPRLRARALAQAQQPSQPTPPPPPPPPMEPPINALDGANDARPAQDAQDSTSNFKLKFCTVCASNQNRYITS